MTRDRAFDLLKAHEAELRRLGVARAALFGSVARNEARPDSDVDVLVDLDPAASLTIYDFVGIRQYLADAFQASVDLVSRGGLSRHVRSDVERDAVYAF